jgi:arsenite methyltransferase
VTESPPTDATADALRDWVRERYAKIASAGGCCSIPDAGADGGCETGGSGGCCSEGSSSAPFCYSTEEIAALPAGADLGLGCGRPSAFADLRPGEVVLDLGSGAGADCFLAGVKVGGSGHVIGVDMTPEMLARARELGRSSGRENVEFRLGEIEHLPVANASVDVVLSNCVINLVPDKGQVYREAFRVLRPGGRLAIADVLATRPIPEEMRNDPGRWSSCSSGALTRDEVTERLRAAGFASIEVSSAGGGPAPRSLGAQEEIGVVSAEVRATKPVSPGT